ncbi:MAG: ethylbenzene dehydrogenase-related protein [bacterium]|nr:ethylbenzene dehydrogenase-related protein [bacterium]
MKTRSVKTVVTALTVMGVTTLMFVVSCTKTNQTLDTPPAQGLPPVVTNPADLICAKATSAPIIDGVADAVWDNATKLNATTQVPDPGNGMFYGYIGTQYPITLRSMYDATNIYFLAEYPDADKSVQVSPWYFNPSTKRWAQEPSAKTFDVNGNITRDGWGEDKLSFLWNIDNSVVKFASQSCYATCHIFTSYLDPTTTPATMKANQSANHYTNGSNEKIDMWWLKIGRDPIHGQFSDEYQDWAGGPSITSLVGGSGNGRHQDDQVVTGSSTSYPYGPAYSSNVTGEGTRNNSQTFTLTVSGKTTTATAPKYIIPGKSDYYYILETDITSGVALTVTGLDTLGKLTLSNASVIDPNIGTDYQRVGDAVYGGGGPKIIPSYISAPLKNNRADISCQVSYTGTSWIIEWKRALKTADTKRQDVDFSSLQDQPFGVAIFNKSNYQHGIKPNLTLKFQK